MNQKELKKAFGLRLRKLRLEANLSQEELAMRANVHRTYIGMVERGEKNVTLTSLMKFAEALDISISELLSNL